MNRDRYIRPMLAAILLLTMISEGSAEETQKSSAEQRSNAAETFQSVVAANPTDRARIVKANQAAVPLLKADRSARNQFNHEHPGVLPQSRLRLPSADAPAFNWCEVKKAPEIRPQLTNDCWAVAATEVLEWSYLIRDGRRVELSPQTLLDNLRRNTSNVSGDCPTAFDDFLREGTATLTQYPYSGHPGQPLTVPHSYRAVDWGYVATNEQAPSILRVKRALLQFGPLATGILHTPQLTHYKQGVFDQPNPPNPGNVRTNHAMVIVGWDDARGSHGAWRVEGTWGPKWGEHGYMWISYGSNNVAYDPVWVQAASTFYSMPQTTFVRFASGAQPLPKVHFVDQTIAHQQSAPNGDQD